MSETNDSVDRFVMQNREDFTCKKCKGGNTTGHKHDAFDDYPEGWHMGCVDCHANWFIKTA